MKPKYKFIGYQETGLKGKKSRVALYNLDWPTHPKHRSTMTLETIKRIIEKEKDRR